MPAPIHVLALTMILCFQHIICHAQSADETSPIASPISGEFMIRMGNDVIGSYIYGDSKIQIPYFTDVKTLSGVKVTRNHPPIAGKDRLDHATMHPGIWLAFGDLDGDDFWRNKATIQHVRFLQQPTSSENAASFSVEQHYVGVDGSIICKEVFNFSSHRLPSSNDEAGGYLMTWDSTFQSDNEFFFGDQEEMGLGIRVATPLSEKEGGQLRDSEGRKNAKNIWSQAARWCDYSGTIDGQSVGMTILCHPQNFRSSWMHARDYGFVAANPFGRQAMKKGKPSKVRVKPGDSLRLRYAIYVHGDEEKLEDSIESAYERYLTLSQDPKD